MVRGLISALRPANFAKNAHKQKQKADKKDENVQNSDRLNVVSSA